MRTHHLFGSVEMQFAALPQTDAATTFTYYSSLRINGKSAKPCIELRRKQQSLRVEVTTPRAIVLRQLCFAGKTVTKAAELSLA